MIRSKSKRTFCMIMTTPLALQFFFHHHLKALSRHFDLTLIANEDCVTLLKSKELEHVKLIVIPIKREISLISDIQAFWMLLKLMKSKRFDVVWSVAPKAGLLGMLAAFLAGIPFRCHMFQGEVWLTRKGMIRQVLKLADFVIARLASQNLVVSASEREFLVQQRILTYTNSRVLGHGSICGVDTSRFFANDKVRNKMRKELGIAESEVVVIFLGRIKVDKGVLDLVAAWHKLYYENIKFSLILVGPDEDGLLESIRSVSNQLINVNCYYEKLTDNPEAWLNTADILCLPSYREGFGNVVIEASSTSLPIVASRIYGITDAMCENVTGLHFSAGSVIELSNSLKALIKNSKLRLDLGHAGSTFVKDNFDSKNVISQFVSFFNKSTP